MYGDQPSLHTRWHLTFTATTIQNSIVDALDAPLIAIRATLVGVPIPHHLILLIGIEVLFLPQGE